MPTRRYLALPLLAVALFAAPISAFAQSAAAPAAPGSSYGSAGPGSQTAPGGRPPGPQRRRGNRMQRVLGSLALSHAQRTKIHGFIRAFRAARRAGNPQPRAQLIAQIEGVLTPPERAKFERRMHRAHPRLPNAGAPPQGPNPGNPRTQPNSGDPQEPPPVQ